MEIFLRFNNILAREMERQQRRLMEGMLWMTLLHKERKKEDWVLLVNEYRHRKDSGSKLP